MNKNKTPKNLIYLASVIVVSVLLLVIVWFFASNKGGQIEEQKHTNAKLQKLEEEITKERKRKDEGIDKLIEKQVEEGVKKKEAESSSGIYVPDIGKIEEKKMPAVEAPEVKHDFEVERKIRERELPPPPPINFGMTSPSSNVSSGPAVFEDYDNGPRGGEVNVIGHQVERVVGAKERSRSRRMEEARFGTYVPGQRAYVDANGNPVYAEEGGIYAEDLPPSSGSSGKGKRGKKYPLDGNWSSPVSGASMPTRVPSEYIVLEGSIIDVVLQNNVNTQHGGIVKLRVVSDIYDSLGHGNLVIPKGSVIIGKYAKIHSSSYTSIPIGLRRLVLPDGRSVILKKSEVSNRMGDFGAEAEFHSNIARALGPNLIVGWLGYEAFKGTMKERVGIAKALGSNGGSGNVQLPPDPVVEATQRAMDIVEERYGSAKPYYTIRAGKRLNIVVGEDIAVPPEAY